MKFFSVGFVVLQLVTFIIFSFWTSVESPFMCSRLLLYFFVNFLYFLFLKILLSLSLVFVAICFYCRLGYFELPYCVCVCGHLL